ncbi:MAG TPA: hypothetical protein VFJ14_10245 [Nocardioidaceae bacterium]|nr:hypothetical protein [Nocardioidaceae bacterium]
MATDWKSRLEADQAAAIVRLSRLPRGVDEVLGLLLLGAESLEELRDGLLNNRLQQHEELGTKPDPHGFPMEAWADHTVLFDLGHLAVAGIVEYEDNAIVILPQYAEAVRTFLLIAFRRHGDCPAKFTNAVNKALRAGVV